MNVENYLRTNNIKYFYFNLKVEDGKKVVSNILMGNTYNIKKITDHNNKYNMANALSHSTKHFNIIDVDNLEYFEKYFGHLDLLNKCPYYLSSSKKLPHIFINIINAPLKEYESVRHGNISVCDLMIKKGTFSLRNEPMIGGDRELITLDYSEIKKIRENIKNDNKNNVLSEQQKIKEQKIQEAKEQRQKQEEQRQKQKEQTKEQKQKEQENKIKQIQEAKEKAKEQKKILKEQKEKEIQEEKKKKKEEREKNKKMNSRTVIYNENFMNILLLDLLPLDYVDSYEGWINIGYAIYNTYGVDGFDMFNDVSKRSEAKYNYDECKKTYKNISKGIKEDKDKIKFGSLVNILKKYTEPYNDYINIRESYYIKKTDLQIAKYIKREYGENYIITGNDKCLSLYKYEKGIYKLYDNVQQIIHGELLMTYANGLKRIYNSLNYVFSHTENETIKETIPDIMTRLCDSLSYAESSKFLTNIYTCMKSLLYQNKFDDKLNTKINLLCFGEYLYDFEVGKFRETTKEDYLSIKCPITKEDIENSDTDEINKYLLSMFPNDEQRQFTLDILSLMLTGESKDYFNVWSAGGGNGKSKFQQIINMMMGKNDYAGELHSSYITTANDKPLSNTVNSELFRNRYSRVLFINEPDENGEVISARLKALSGGGDEVAARSLFQNAITYKPQFTVIILCNDKFPLKNPNEDCMLRRLKFNKFTQTFDDSKIGLPNVQKRDPRLVDNEYLKTLSIGLMKLLLLNYNQARKKLMGQTIEEPEICKVYKNEFYDLNDPLTDFYNSNIEITKNPKDCVLFTDIMDKYREFCHTYNYKPVGKNQLLQSIKSVHGSNNYKKDRRVKLEGTNDIKHYRNVFINMIIKNDMDDELYIKEGTEIDVEDNEGNIIRTEKYVKNEAE